MYHLLTNQLIKKNSQMAFMKNKFCLTSLEFLHINHSEPMDVVYLDFPKTFDNVSKCRVDKNQGARYRWSSSYLILINGDACLGNKCMQFI